MVIKELQIHDNGTANQAEHMHYTENSIFVLESMDGDGSAQVTCGPKARNCSHIRRGRSYGLSNGCKTIEQYMTPRDRVCTWLYAKLTGWLHGT